MTAGNIFCYQAFEGHSKLVMVLAAKSPRSLPVPEY